VTAGRRAQTADVIVVGAGPAGSAAAITLARLGRRVVLIDKAVFPRDKCCGDGLTTAALRSLERLGLDPADLASWQPSSSVSVGTAGGGHIDLPFPTDGVFAATVCRRDLDWALVRLADRSGVRVLQGHPLTSVRLHPDGGVVVQTEDGPALRSDYVIAADGMWSDTRRALGLTAAGYLGDWQAGRQYYESVGPEARKLWIWFEPDMIPGYAWSFPLPDGRANVGYGVIRRSGDDPARSDLRGQRIELLERPRIAEVLGPAARPCGPWRSWPIPTTISRGTLSGLGGRVLFVGDAARAADPMTGEGIAQALETAETAARAIAASGAHPASAARRYNLRVRFSISVDHRVSGLLSKILARPTGSDRSLALLEFDDRLRTPFARWMFEDCPRALVLTPHRWALRRRSGSGAYLGRSETTPVTRGLAVDADWDVGSPRH
jgi:menaquinone-9 beta-reductase